MIKIASIQTNIFWEDPKTNKREYDKLFPSLEAFDLIILPEMFTTGFSMMANKIAENNSGETLSWMQQHSKKLDTCIVGSLPIKDDYKILSTTVKPNEVHNMTKDIFFQWLRKINTIQRGRKNLFLK